MTTLRDRRSLDITVRFALTRLGPQEYDCIAMITTGHSNHNGQAKTPAEALVNAAMHWLAYVRSQPPAPGPMVVAPVNWQNPDWESARRVHDWRNHVAHIVRAMWSTFTDEQKQALAISAQQAADREEWE